jgi:putative tryptophan/tyrosine transport system substrate-binding protein
MRGDRLKRRDFMAFLGGAAAFPLVASAQQPALPVIGFLSSRAAAESAGPVAAFARGLGEVGFVIDQNVRIERRWAEGYYDRLPALAAELVQLHVDVIATGGSQVSVLAAKAATSTIPIVFAGVPEPVQFGVVASINRPGGNVTGSSIFASELSSKRLELLHRMIPGATRIAMLADPNYPSAERQEKETVEAARAFGLQVRVLNAGTESAIDAAFATMVQERTEALDVMPGPYFAGRRDQLIALAARDRIPAIFGERQYVVAGGLMTYGTNLPDSYRQAGVYVGRVLKGEKPADLPVLLPTMFEFVINMKTVKTLGLTVPPELLALTDNVIE